MVAVAQRAAGERSGGWKIAEVAGPDVLTLRVALIDVVVTAAPEPLSTATTC